MIAGGIERTVAQGEGMMSLHGYLAYLDEALKKISSREVEELIELLVRAREDGSMVFVIGNGGSAANASHFAQDLAKGTTSGPEDVIRLRALSLTDNLPYISALGNDEGYDQIFVQQLRTFARAGDLLISISGSGNSANILAANAWASANGMTTVGVTGFDGGELRPAVDHALHVPLDDMCTAESVHSILFHYIVLELKRRFHS